MNGVLDVFTAFGLSASAGMKAYLTLFLVGLLARFTPLLHLESPYDLLTNEWVLGVLGVLTLVEFLVDKIPAADSVNDFINTVCRPLAGAIVFASTSGVVSEMHPVLALIAGLLVSGGVHFVKASARPVITATTFGAGNPIVSLIEDVAAVALIFLAIFFSALGVALVIGLAAFLAWWLVRRQQRARYAARGA